MAPKKSLAGVETTDFFMALNALVLMRLEEARVVAESVPRVF